jgi:hypothetical protein
MFKLLVGIYKLSASEHGREILFEILFPTIRRKLMKPLYFIIAIITATIGYHIHHSGFWAIIDFFLWPFAWAKWIICQEVSLSIIKESLAWFFQ